MATLRLNQVVLGGNLTRDPVLRRLPSGSSVAEFGLAIDDGYTSKTGEQVKQTCFVDVVVWDRRAESVHAYLHKGDCVIVVGRLTYQSWVNDKGERRSRLRVTAHNLQFVGGGRRSEAEALAEDEAGVPDPVEVGESDDDLPF